MSEDINKDAYLAGRLIRWGLTVRAQPAHEQEYQQLIGRFESDLVFRALVRETVAGLGLSVLAASGRGFVLAPDGESPFLMAPTSFRGRAFQNSDERLLNGLVQVGVAATVFPRAEDLEASDTLTRPPITVAEVEEQLRSLSLRFEEATKGKPDPEATGLYEAWRVYQKYRPVKETNDGRQAPLSTRRIIQANLEQLVAQGCFLEKVFEGEQRFQPTWRYQVLVQELAASQLYEHIQSVLCPS